jgi:hypothetical protein
MLRTYRWYKQRFSADSYGDGEETFGLEDLLFKAQTLPVVRLTVAGLLHNLRTTETDEVVGSPEFVQRALAADGRYPILCLQKRGRRLIVMDGLHRLWKAHHLNRILISARVFDYRDLPKPLS